MPAPGYTKRRAVWTREAIIEAIQDWAAKHDGQPPSATEWNPSDCRYSAELSAARAGAWLERVADFEGGEYPWTGTVVKKFARWNDAIKEAGFTPRRATILNGTYERKGPRRRTSLSALRKSIDAIDKASGEARRRALYGLARQALRMAEETEQGDSR